MYIGAGIYYSGIVRVWLFITLCSFVFLFYFSYSYRAENYKTLSNDYYRNIRFRPESYENDVKRFIDKRQVWTTTNLGSVLFKFEDISNYVVQENRTYVVLIWKYWGWLKNRHVYNYGSAKGDDILGDCSVKNCIFSGDDELLATADAVLIHLQKGDIPQVENRNLKQRWVFLNDESPRNAFSLTKRKLHWSNFTEVFNWSMTYRTDADVPVPYGRTVPLSKSIIPGFPDSSQITKLIPNWNIKRYDVLATVLMSNCHVKRRMDFLNELRNYMAVDVYGNCADNNTTKNRCPGHFRSDCQPVSEYLFYLVLENSMCHQYLTEKAFYHAYMKGSIPVIMGPSITDCENLLPPNSYLYVDDSTNIEALAEQMFAISQVPNLLYSFHVWRYYFKVVNEHGYFGTRSYHLCRLCEALNYNDEAPKIYEEDDLKRFLDPAVTCK